MSLSAATDTHHDHATTPVGGENATVAGGWVEYGGETFYRIDNVDRMPVFLMSIISGSDHWLFVASNGGLTAGRRNVDSALFPYETEDKLAANRATTGSTTVMRVTRGPRTVLWEPFIDGGPRSFHVERALYKNIPGTAVVFEEVNHSLSLRFRVSWRTGDRCGFVRTCAIDNVGDAPCQVELIDGIQNVLPAGASEGMQTRMSSLLNAYKRNEVEESSGVGIFSMSATLTDLAEPSESLRATVAWQTGLADATVLLTADQLRGFREGRAVTPERDRCGVAGSYLVHTRLDLARGDLREWYVVADVQQDTAAVASLCSLLVQTSHAERAAMLEDDIQRNTEALLSYVAASDGLQYTADKETTAHHVANVMFNIMRGGAPADGYTVLRDDLRQFIATRNRPVAGRHADWLAALPEQFALGEMYRRAEETGSADLVRLCHEYLPLTFSRRHGDPSRPWNSFSINVKEADGSPRLDYQGNWRDIFQNWEPLLISFPDAAPGVIAKFLDATTPDGYNPYRVTRDGIDWEVPEPDDSWSNIGYWSDHQIIYLQKLLEVAEETAPGTWARLSGEAVFSYADVPYRLRPYAEMLNDWSDTIVFDEEAHRSTMAAVATMGTDGRLCRDAEGRVVHATMTEKLLVLLLAKLVNLVPGGGIWMNTQRPEWNDANNALVGKGLSVVTTAYLRRFIAWWLDRLDDAELSDADADVAAPVARLCAAVSDVLSRSRKLVDGGVSATSRRDFMDAMGAIATDYRKNIYRDGLGSTRTPLPAASVRTLLEVALVFVEGTLRANRGADGLYHSYNILALGDGTAEVHHLYPMLEGQVAILSSGMLDARAALDVLASLRASELYRADQHSYMLYPRRELPGFLEKNNVAAERVASLRLVEALRSRDDRRLLVADTEGTLHFNGHFRNAVDVTRALDALAGEEPLAPLVAADRQEILAIFEETFDHRSFTGRSGTFFAYEGLGSIYWHMVSKLLLAAQEVALRATADGADDSIRVALADAYYDIRAGLGFNKEPEVYGAFPTDPYSHTPWGAGARQPGMTGQVKEEILTRWGELGVGVAGGRLRFAPTLLCIEEFTAEAGSFEWIGYDGESWTLAVPAGALAFTVCQTPVVYSLAERAEISVQWSDGHTTRSADSAVDEAVTRALFGRTGEVAQLRVSVPRSACRHCR